MSSRPEPPEDLATPGLSWRPRKTKTTERGELHWVANQKVAKRGYPIKTRRLWCSGPMSAPTPDEWLEIASRCIALQAEMNEWAHGGVTSDPRSVYDGTFASLVRIYQTDIDSGYHELRYGTRLDYDRKLTTLVAAVGAARLADMTFRDFKRWHAGFRGDEDRISRAHSLMTHVRIVIKFGGLLELPDCARLSALLADMEFEGPKRRKEFMTLQQARAVIAEANRQGLHSIALAQAFMFELSLRQRDVIGEWIPSSEPGTSVILWHGRKWLHGLHWRDIDEELVLRKRISKSLRGRRAAATPGAGKVEEFDLRSYPMVMEELTWHQRCDTASIAAKNLASLPITTTMIPVESKNAIERPVMLASRSLPKPTSSSTEIWAGITGNGPLIICESTGRPWTRDFSRYWRKIADAAGVPRNVCNKDSRAGSLSEGESAGATIEMLRHQAGHSTTAMTARYVRNQSETRNKVAQLRVESRKK